MNIHRDPDHVDSAIVRRCQTFPEREAAEAKEREDSEKARLESLRPEKEKLKNFADFLANEIVYPKVVDKTADEIVISAWHVINDLAASIIKDAGRM